MQFFDSDGNEWLAFSPTRVIRLSEHESALWKKLQDLHNHHTARFGIELFLAYILGVVVDWYVSIKLGNVPLGFILLIAAMACEVARTWKRDRRWSQEIADARKEIVQRICGTVPESYIVKTVDGKIM